MRKYFAFFTATLKEEFANLSNSIGTIIAYCIHVIILSQLWKFVVNTGELQGYTFNQLVWYSILAEAVLYSFYSYYKKIAAKIEDGTVAYNLSKPYNFMGRIVSEGLAALPVTFIILIAGFVIGLIIAGPLNLNLLQLFFVFFVFCISAFMLLTINMIVGLLSIWLGRDVSSIWLLIQKTMLIFIFTPVEFMPQFLQIPLKLLPTTNVIYTPSKLLVKFSYPLLLESLMYEAISFLILGVVCYVIYKKGAKNLNVNGV